MIKIIIVDDHAVVRSGIKNILSDVNNVTVVAEAGNGREALNLLKKEAVDILLLDISLPDRSGLELLQVIRDEHPDVSILILTMHPEEQYAVRALKNGASGYLTKDSAPSELINAIKKVSSGKKYISIPLAEKLVDMLDVTTNKALHMKLSDREFDVMCLIAAGKSLTEISNELHLSIKTISTYKSRILEKMDFNNTADIIRYTIKNNLSY